MHDPNQTAAHLETLLIEAGLGTDDPYRWLEADDEAVRSWDERQNKLAVEAVHAWPHLEDLRRLMAHFGLLRRSSVPRWAGGNWFRIDRESPIGHDRAVVAAEPFGSGRVIFDPADEHPDNPPYVSWISPSPDGTILAVGVCLPASERNTIRLIDVATGVVLPDLPQQVLADSWTGGVQWLGDANAFLFMAVDGFFRHRRDAKGGPTTEPITVPWSQPGAFGIVVVSRDGRHVTAYEGIMDPLPVAIATVGPAGELDWQPFVTGLQAAVIGHVVGDRFVAVTTIGAPRGRVVAIPLDSPTANEPATWQELLGPSDRVLRHVQPIADRLYVTGLDDTYACVTVVRLDGSVEQEVPLPGRGALPDGGPSPVMQLLPKGHPDEFVFTFSTFTAWSGVYRHVPGATAVEELRPPQARLDGVVTIDRKATSTGGVAVPYHVIARGDIDLTQPQPTLIFAYGGLNVALPPFLPDGMAAFIASGGVYVHAHLRGGAEYGLQWWHDGRLRTKQHSYDDLYAIAEDLIAEGMTTPAQLAVSGGSHGGLMAGVAMTQRPDLWAAAVPRVPMLDLIASCRDPYGRMVVAAELADPDDPDELRRLATFSPYHLIRHGQRYPAVFIDAGATDHRCPPWHARKFGARLQEVLGSEEAVLVRIRPDAGHGLAANPAVTMELNVEWLAFTMSVLGMTPARLAGGRPGRPG